LQTKFKAYTELTFAMIIAGSSVVVSKLLVQTLPVFLASECSLIVALTILVPLTCMTKKDIPKIGIKTISVLFLQSATGIFIFRVFLFFGLKFTSAIESSLITSTSPAMVGLLAFFLLKEKLSLNRVIGIIFVVVGLLIVNVYSSATISSNINSMKGNALILIAIAGEALFSILSKMTNNIPPIYRTTLITLFAAVFFIPFSIYDILHFDFTKINYTAFLSILYYGTFVSVISYILWFKGISKVPASNAAVFTGIMSVSSILLSSIILKERILHSHIISLIFIIFGICFSCSSSKDYLIFNMRKNTNKPEPHTLNNDVSE
jgi:Permeases of the drug/metabolite transporter (DMT) superfamily